MKVSAQEADHILSAQLGPHRGVLLYAGCEVNGTELAFVELEQPFVASNFANSLCCILQTFVSNLFAILLLQFWPLVVLPISARAMLYAIEGPLIGPCCRGCAELRCFHSQQSIYRHLSSEDKRKRQGLKETLALANGELHQLLHLKTR